VPTRHQILVLVTVFASTAAMGAEQIVPSIEARSTPLYGRRDGRVCRLVDVFIALTAPATEVLLQAEVAGQKSEVSIKEMPLSGPISREIGVPDSPDPIDVKITATIGEQSQTTMVRVMPERKWRIFVAPSSHTDIGYDHLQTECAEIHNRNTDAAIDVLHRFPDFRWNLEVAWQAENYVNSRNKEQVADFYRLAREGKIGVQALYANILTGLCSTETACRLTWFAHKLCREQGIPYESAMISDVPTQEASLPTILSGAGIRYLSSGINTVRALTFTQMQGQSPCWWEGPDGSRVLMVYAPGYGDSWALDRSVDDAKERVIAALQHYASRENYPYDAVFLHGTSSDNCLMGPRLPEVAKEWNARYEFPKVILSHNAEFFQYIEKHYGDKLPVVRGSAGTYWEDGAGSTARETALVRNAQEMAANGERFLALAERIGQVKQCQPDDIYQIWRNCLLYDEHTWSAQLYQETLPVSSFTQALWKVKAQWATDAADGAKTLLDKGAGALASLVRTDGPALVVFNPTSWPRTDILRVNLPEGIGVVEPDVQWHASPDGTLILVKDVPPCGYRVLKVAPQGDCPNYCVSRNGTVPCDAVNAETGPYSTKVERGPPRANPVERKPAEGTVIESRFYRVQFDPAGGIVSIHDKELGRELVDQKAPYRLNQYVYVAGGKGTMIEGFNGPIPPNTPDAKLEISVSDHATLHRAQLPGLGEMMQVETAGTMAPKITNEIIVWDAIKRIDIVNHLTKTLTHDKESVYFAFPFEAKEPTFRYEAPAAIVNANTDMLPGACLDWFTVQHFVEVAGQDVAIAWATLDAPLVCFQDVNRGKWQTKLPMTNGHLYAYVMNNYWPLNYAAGQGGDYTFRFAITSRPKGDNVASAQFGWGMSNALLGVAVMPNLRGPLPQGPTSLVSIAEPNVVVVGAKLADEGSALVVRLWELSGQPTTAHLRLDGRIPAVKATACNLVEERQQPLEIRDGEVAVPIRGQGLATIRVE
jgi:alpha-mannosidase